MPVAAAGGSGGVRFLVVIELVLVLLGVVLAVIAELIDRSRSAFVSAVGAVFLLVGIALVVASL